MPTLHEPLACQFVGTGSSFDSAEQMPSKFYCRHRAAPATVMGPAMIAQIHDALPAVWLAEDVQVLPAVGQSYGEVRDAHNWTPLTSELVNTPTDPAPAAPLVDEFGQPFEVRCPFCAEQILSTARKCKHCGEWVRQATTDVLPTPRATVEPSVSVNYGRGNAGAAFGWLLTALGLFGLIFALTMDTSVEAGGEDLGFGVSTPRMRVNNLGLMDQRRNFLMISGLGVLVGVVLIVANRKHST